MTYKNKVQAWMQKNQREAGKIMDASGKIWEKNKWQSGGDVNKDVLKAELRKVIGKKKLSPVVAEILEDANFHSEQSALEDIGAVKYPKRRQLGKYFKAGGKTWNMFD